jgi:hypothetical protein
VKDNLMIILVVAAILIVVIGYIVGRSKQEPRSGSGSAESSAGDGGSSIMYTSGSTADSGSHHGHHGGHGDGGDGGGSH